MSDGGGEGLLLPIAGHFLVFSLLAVGGANAVVPEMHRQVVDIHHWMTGSEFIELFALAQAAPGPNALIVTLIGWKLAGIPGGLVATAAMCVPTSLLAFAVDKVWSRSGAAPWHHAVRAGLAPITVGLILSTAYLLAASSNKTLAAWLMTSATTVFVLTTRRNPLWMMGAAALLGVFQLFAG